MKNNSFSLLYQYRRISHQNRSDFQSFIFSRRKSWNKLRTEKRSSPSAYFDYNFLEKNVSLLNLRQSNLLLKLQQTRWYKLSSFVSFSSTTILTVPVSECNYRLSVDIHNNRHRSNWDVSSLIAYWDITAVIFRELLS